MYMSYLRYIINYTCRNLHECMYHSESHSGMYVCMYDMLYVHTIKFKKFNVVCCMSCML